MARVPYPDPTKLKPETQEVLGKMPPLNIFRMMAGAEGLLQAFTRMGNYLLFKSKLDPILREIAIIRTGVLSKATYEVHQHERIGRDLGMSDALIKGIHAGPDDAAFNDLQRLVVLYTDDVVRNVRAGDQTFKPLSEHLSLQRMQELTVTIGYYMMVSRFLETFDVDIEQPGDEGRFVSRFTKAQIVSEAVERRMAAELRGEAPGRGRLKGRRILVVGGGQDTRGLDDPPIGNGRAMSILFAREGARVAVADRNLESAKATLALTKDQSSVAFEANVAVPDEVKTMVGHAVSKLGGLDGVVYNVGIGAGMWLEGSTPEIWDRVFAVNLRGAMLTLQAALPVLADGSSIVLISSIAAMKAGSRMPSYDASKAALGGLMRHAGIEGERRGIRVNIVAPGLMDTSIGREATRGRPGRAKTPVPLGRQGTGWETAYAALFLMSDEAAYITGQTLAVDGGMTGLR